MLWRLMGQVMDEGHFLLLEVAFTGNLFYFIEVGWLVGLVFFLVDAFESVNIRFGVLWGVRATGRSFLVLVSGFSSVEFGGDGGEGEGREMVVVVALIGTYLSICCETYRM